MLVLEGPVGLHKTFNFSFFSIIGRIIDLDYHDVEWFTLETNRDYSVIFEIASKYCISERLEVSSRKLEIPREHFMQRWVNKGQTLYGPNRSRRY